MLASRHLSRAPATPERLRWVTSRVRVRLTSRLLSRLTNPNLRLVAETMPLGAAVGDTVVLRVPGMAPQPFVIQAIKRSAEGDTG